LQGTAFLTDLGLTQGKLSIHTDSISLVARHTDTAESILLRSEAADVDWTGKYKLTQVPESIMQFINKYYKLPVAKTDSTEPEQWQMAIRLRTSPTAIRFKSTSRLFTS
jgi:hypothetical protein